MGAYAFYYMTVVVKMNLLASEVVYMVYATVATISFMVVCGSVAVAASMLFVVGIYSKVKKVQD